MDGKIKDKYQSVSNKKRDIFRVAESEKNGTTAEEVVTRLREMIQRSDISRRR